MPNVSCERLQVQSGFTEGSRSHVSLSLYLVVGAAENGQAHLGVGAGRAARPWHASRGCRSTSGHVRRYPGSEPASLANACRLARLSPRLTRQAHSRRIDDANPSLRAWSKFSSE